jgi:hypothetical protein
VLESVKRKPAGLIPGQLQAISLPIRDTDAHNRQVSVDIDQESIGKGKTVADTELKWTVELGPIEQCSANDSSLSSRGHSSARLRHRSCQPALDSPHIRAKRRYGSVCSGHETQAQKILSATSNTLTMSSSVGVPFLYGFSIFHYSRVNLSRPNCLISARLSRFGPCYPSSAASHLLPT